MADEKTEKTSLVTVSLKSQKAIELTFMAHRRIWVTSEVGKTRIEDRGETNELQEI